MKYPNKDYIEHLHAANYTARQAACIINGFATADGTA